MESLYFLIPLAIVFVVIAISLFFWAIRSGQFDDLDTQAKRILFDDATAVVKTVSAEEPVTQGEASTAPVDQDRENNSSSTHLASEDLVAQSDKER